MIEQCLGALAAHDCIGHDVRVLLVGVADLPHATLELHTSALLDHVRGFMRGGVNIWCARECDAISRCERLGTHRCSALGRAAANVRPKKPVGIFPQLRWSHRTLLEQLGRDAKQIRHVESFIAAAHHDTDAFHRQI